VLASATTVRSSSLLSEVRLTAHGSRPIRRSTPLATRLVTPDDRVQDLEEHAVDRGGGSAMRSGYKAPNVWGANLAEDDEHDGEDADADSRQ